ncbi:hypothetical protein ACUR5C_05930 [Aliikangiella sp. IMCC44653]
MSRFYLLFVVVALSGCSKSFINTAPVSNSVESACVLFATDGWQLLSKPNAALVEAVNLRSPLAPKRSRLWFENNNQVGVCEYDDAKDKPHPICGSTYFLFQPQIVSSKAADLKVTFEALTVCSDN